MFVETGSLFLAAHDCQEIACDPGVNATSVACLVLLLGCLCIVVACVAGFPECGSSLIGGSACDVASDLRLVIRVLTFAS